MSLRSIDRVDSVSRTMSVTQDLSVTVTSNGVSGNPIALARATNYLAIAKPMGRENNLEHAALGYIFLAEPVMNLALRGRGNANAVVDRGLVFFDLDFKRNEPLQTIVAWGN